jgi:branched-chain amino acid aminotransferase
MQAWLNGKMVDWRETHVSLLSHGFSRASAIFEVVDVAATRRGTVCFGLPQHIDRFLHSAELIAMTLPFSREELTAGVIDCIRANRLSAGIVKFFAYYPDVEFALIPTSPRVNIAIFAIDIRAVTNDREGLETPINVGVSMVRKLHPESTHLHAKVTGNYTNGYLASLDVRKRGFQEAILLDTMGYVAEGPTSNIFLVRNRQVFTPYLRCALPGITRMAAIKALREMNYVVREMDIKGDELADFEEAFFTSSILRIRPIRTINGRKIGPVCPGPVTGVLKNRLVDVVEGNQETMRDFLTIVPPAR